MNTTMMTSIVRLESHTGQNTEGIKEGTRMKKGIKSSMTKNHYQKLGISIMGENLVRLERKWLKVYWKPWTITSELAHDLNKAHLSTHALLKKAGNPREQSKISSLYSVLKSQYPKFRELKMLDRYKVTKALFKITFEDMERKQHRPSVVQKTLRHFDLTDESRVILELSHRGFRPSMNLAIDKPYLYNWKHKYYLQLEEFDKWNIYQMQSIYGIWGTRVEQNY